MPIYEYKCDNGHVFDVLQKMSDDPVSECHECGAAAVRVLHPVAVHFKGSGFYNTDYGKKKAGDDGASAEGGESKPSDSGADGKSSDSTGSDSKSSDSSSGDSKAKAASAD